MAVEQNLKNWSRLQLNPVVVVRKRMKFDDPAESLSTWAHAAMSNQDWDSKELTSVKFMCNFTCSRPTHHLFTLLKLAASDLLLNASLYPIHSRKPPYLLPASATCISDLQPPKKTATPWLSHGLELYYLHAVQTFTDDENKATTKTNRLIWHDYYTVFFLSHLAAIVDNVFIQRLQPLL